MTARHIRGFGAALALLASSGCAQNFDAAKAGTIHLIAVSSTGNPDHVGLAVGNFGAALAIGLAAGPGAFSGVLGGSLAGSARASTLTEALAGQNLRLGDELDAALAEALRQDGYETTSGLAQADAVLSTAIKEITYERRVWGRIAPHLVLEVRLAALDGRLLFRRTYGYDPSIQTVGYTIFRPADQYGFDEPAEVLSHPDIAAAGLLAAIPMIAADVGAALRR